METAVYICTANIWHGHLGLELIIVMASLLLLLSLPLTILALTASCAQTNITLGSSLPATAGAAWSSPSGNFALGFYPVEGGLAVGAWLATTPNITVTWTANRNATPSTGGSLSLNHDGQLVWSADGQNVTIAETSQSATAAAMRDDGNFVMYGTDATTIIWSTFGAPTDTLCAGQDLLPGQQLFSSVSDTNKATGKYRLDNQDDANLVLYPVGTTNVANSAYWASNTGSVGRLLTLRLDANGVLYLVDKNGSYTKNLTQPRAPAQVGSHAYYRATLDPDGILRVYGHALSANGGWKTDVEWVALSDRCSVKGVCGANSYCVLDRDARPTCACPPGFSFVNTSNLGLGCEANAGVGDCSAGGVDAASAAVMAGLANVSWTDTPYMLLPHGMSAADCGAACLSDCFCTAVLHDSNDGGTCTKQQLPLMYGHAGGPYTLFVKTRATAATLARRRKDGRGVGRAATIALVCMALLTCFSLSAFLVFARLLWVNLKAVHHDVMSLSLANANAADALDEEAPLRSYTYRELKEATHGFRDPIGRGAFGAVFKGSLNGGEKIIAVKRLEKLVEDGEREFQREVRAIGRASHRNLVRLLGFCHEGANRLLVYEFMSNGSLADLLFRGTSRPAWPDRVRIALDVARGLHYLHDELDSRVIHCDVKPQNILMDAAGKAKIADFGLAKLLLPDQTRTFTGVRGTRGYLAPEWYRGTGPVTVKADVYSYGVVLLETVTCKRNMEMEEAGEDCTLMEWAYGCLVRGELRRSTMTDTSDEEEAVEEEMLERVVKVGIWCVQEEPQSRPSMKNVILMLEGNMEVSFPPPPPSSL